MDAASSEKLKSAFKIVNRAQDIIPEDSCLRSTYSTEVESESESTKGGRRKKEPLNRENKSKEEKNERENKRRTSKLAQELRLSPGLPKGV